MVPHKDRSHRDGKRDPEESYSLRSSLFPLRAEITAIKRETEGTKTYSLFLENSLYKAKPGQFNMVGYPGVGEAPISLSSNVTNGGFQHTIRAVGKVTKFIDRLKRGNEIYLRGPYGTWWPLESAVGKDIILAAGGLGLAPIRPAIQEIVRKRNSFGKVTLIYGARNPDSIPFRDEFNLWSNDLEVLSTVDEVPSHVKWDHSIGLVTQLLDKVALKLEKTFVFICGPEIMMLFISRGLFLRGFPPSRVFVSLERRMKCGIAQCGHCQHGGRFVCKDGPIFPHRDISRLPDGIL